MPNLNKIKLPDNTVLDINDARIPGVDSTPTQSSTNVVTSGGVYSAIDAAGIKASVANRTLTLQGASYSNRTITI